MSSPRTLEQTPGRDAARSLLVSGVIRAARDMRDASRNCFEGEPEAYDAWDGLNQALTALDDFAAMLATIEE